MQTSTQSQDNSRSEDATNGSAASLRNQWRREHRQLINRLSRLSNGRHTEIGHSLYKAQRNRVLHSVSCKAAIIAHIVGPDVSDEAILSQANEIDMFARHTETVRWFRKAKPSGGLRTICAPSLALKARQRLLTHMIVAQQAPSPHFYNRKGKGCARQAREIARAFESGGNFVVIADVTHCFPSVNFDAVYDLDLVQPEVLRFASDGRHLNLMEAPDACLNAQHDTTNTLTDVIDVQTGPRGLLQGLGSSDALWTSLISDLPEALSPHGVPFIYCDNIAVVCSTSGEAAGAEETLVRYFSDHRAGPFSLTTQIHDASEYIEHTGYMFSSGPTAEGIKAVIVPSIANQCKLVRRLHDEVWQIRRSDDRVRGVTELLENHCYGARKLLNVLMSGISATSPDYREDILSNFVAELIAILPLDLADQP